MSFINPLLDFTIGMIAFFLFASLLVTALQEAVANWLGLRAKTLRTEISRLFNEKPDG